MFFCDPQAADGSGIGGTNGRGIGGTDVCGISCTDAGRIGCSSTDAGALVVTVGSVPEVLTLVGPMPLCTDVCDIGGTDVGSVGLIFGIGGSDGDTRVSC